MTITSDEERNLVNESEDEVMETVNSEMKRELELYRLVLSLSLMSDINGWVHEHQSSVK